MVDIVGVLKRKDGAALVVGVAVGLFVAQYVTTITTDVSNRLANIGNHVGAGAGFRGGYLLPTVVFVVQLLALEILTRLYVMAHDMMDK